MVPSPSGHYQCEAKVRGGARFARVVMLPPAGRHATGRSGQRAIRQGMLPVGATSALKCCRRRTLVTTWPSVQAALPYALHLSYRSILTQDALARTEHEFIVSLFFTPAERPLLYGHGGQMTPMVHVYLGDPSADLGDC